MLLQAVPHPDNDALPSDDAPRTDFPHRQRDYAHLAVSLHSRRQHCRAWPRPEQHYVAPLRVRDT